MINVELKEDRLGSSDCSPFITISYVWGTANATRAILVNGERFLVLEAVYPILKWFCKPSNAGFGTWIWIDSVCINQTDHSEREAQVGLMGSIFKCSQRTMAWLGPATPATNNAMEFLLTLSRNTGPRRDYARKQIRKMPPELNVPSKWRSLGILFALPWWTRAWTLQEMAIPTELVFLCGNKSIGHHSFNLAISTLWCCNPDNDLLDLPLRMAPWTRARLRDRYGVSGGMGLVALLAYSSDCQLSDPRDRIYSLLGVSRQTDRELIGRVDYSSNVRTVYADLVKNFIKKHESLDIICLAHRFHSSTNSQDEALPSWVPDWRTRVTPFVTPTMVSQAGNAVISAFLPPWAESRLSANMDIYAASSSLKPRISFSEDFRELICTGLLIDYIDGLSAVNTTLDIDGTPEHGLVQSTSAANRRSSLDYDQDDTDELVDLIVRCLVLNRKDRYLSYALSASIQEQLREELVGLMRRDRRCCNEGMVQKFDSWLNGSGELLIRGTTLGHIFETSCRRKRDPPSCTDLHNNSAIDTPQVSADPAHGQSSVINTTEDGFLSRFHDTTFTTTMATRLITTTQGSVGMGPLRAEKGDMVCILFGCSVPVVLRRVSSDNIKHQRFHFVGECYLDGYMNGEAIDCVISRDQTLDPRLSGIGEQLVIL